VLLVRAGSVAGRGIVGSGVGSLYRLGGGTPVSLCLQSVCEFVAVADWQGRHSAVWFYQSIAACLSIAAFTFLHPGISTPRFFSFRTSPRGFLIRYWVSSIDAKTHFGHFGYIQGQAHVGLFQLYNTSLPCHHSRHVAYLQVISCSFKQWDAAITSTIYASVASSRVIKDCFIHSRGWLLRNWSAKIIQLTTSWCSILRTGQSNALVNHDGFPLWAAIN